MFRKRIIAASLLAGVSLFAACSTMNRQDFVNCEVKAKDMVYESDGHGGMSKVKRVTTTCGSFNVEDNIAGGFNSWDIWSQLEVGKTYDIRAGGYRVGFLSMFPNILEVRERD